MIPEHLLTAWHEVEAIADTNPRKGLKAAAAWGAALAEYDIAQAAHDESKAA